MKKFVVPTKIKTSSLVFLKFTFWISLLGILFSIVLTYILHTVFHFYFLSYILISFIAISAFNPIYKKKIFGVSCNVYALIIYSIIITAPITFINGDIIAFIVFYKDFLLPLILFLYYVIKLNNLKKTINFIKTVVIGGLFFGIYISFEFINKITNLFPLLNQIIYDYVSLSKLEAAKNFMDPDQFDVFSIIRPLGLEATFTASGYFLSSIFFIVLISGKRFFKNEFARVLSITILYLGVFFSSSRQIIYIMHFLLLLLLVIVIQKHKLFNSLLLLNIKRNLRIVFFLIGLLILIISIVYINTQYIEFVSKASTGSILNNDLKDLPNIFGYIFSEYPLNAIFGIGAYTPSYPGLTPYLPHINELHFLLDIPYVLGIVGFIIYWSIFIVSVRTCWRAFKIKRESPDSYQDLFLSGVFIALLFMACVVHYSPIGLGTNFIIALIPLLSIYAQREIILHGKIAIN